MLVLTRCLGEGVRIGDDITVTVLRIKGGAIQIGVAAPRDLAVHREEIYARLKPSPAPSKLHLSRREDLDAVSP